MAEENKLATIGSAPGALERARRPADAGETREGTEHITRDDLKLPRLCIAQDTTKQLKEEKPEYIKDLRRGELFNDLSGRIYGKGPITFMIVRADPPRYIEFHPLAQGGGVKDMDVQPGDPRTRFGPNGEPPVATKFYDFVIFMPDYAETIGLSMKGTSIKTAKRLNSLISERNAALYEGLYTVKVGSETNPKGTYSIYLVDNCGTESQWCARDAEGPMPGWAGPELKEFGRQRYAALKGKTIDMAREPGEEG